MQQEGLASVEMDASDNGAMNNNGAIDGERTEVSVDASPMSCTGSIGHRCPVLPKSYRYCTSRADQPP